ncbi:MAG: hypothetical protein ACK559_25430, partial [bacterium]
MLARGADLDHKCCVCEELFTTHDGVTCPAEVGHFTCQAHLEQAVEVRCAETTAVLVQRPAIVTCSQLRCEAAYSEQSLLTRLPRPLVELYRATQMRVTEEVVHRRLEPEFAAKLAAEVLRMAQLSETERQVRMHRNNVHAEILTLKCPRAGCGQAFVDFTGCLALTCKRCGCGFCAICQADCGTNAHDHAE